MDPVGPWSAYAASYNRLTSGGFQNGQSELHHLGTGGGPVQASSTTSQLLFQAHANSSFANTASPFNHNGFLSPPPVPYEAVFTPLFHQKAHYRPLKQTEAYNVAPTGNMFDQNNSSIGWPQNNQLPSPFGILPHESVPNSAKPYENFNHFSQPFNTQLDYKNSPYDPKKCPPSPTKTNSFYSESNFKPVDYPKFQNGHLQQSCAGSMPPKEYRIPQPPRQFTQRTEKAREFTPPTKPLHQMDQSERRENEIQSSPISFAMMDGHRNFHKLRTQQYHLNQQHYRFSSADDYRNKASDVFSSNSATADCAAVKRPSPLHQQSPIQVTQSPVYPLYNSPMTSISSPSPVQHDICYNKTEVSPPIDASLPRNVTNYHSVITRSDKNFPDNRFERPDYNKHWDERQRKFLNYDVQVPQKQQYLDSAPQVALQDLSSCRGDPMSLVKTLQQQQPEKVLEDKQRRTKSSEKPDDYYGRVPPPAHHNGNLQNQNSYYEFERWNIPPPKMFSNSPVTFTSQSTLSNFTGVQHQSIVVPPLPYFPAFHVPSVQPNDEADTEKTRPKSVPNIEEELSFLSEENFPWDNMKERKILAPNPRASFMSSYVKFLQGDKDSSPPPNPRPIPRTTWVLSKSMANPSIKQSDFPADPQDDPRYFPLPRTSQERNFDSSQSEWSENELGFNPRCETNNNNQENVKEHWENKEEVDTNKLDKNPKQTKKKKRRKRMNRRNKGDDFPLPRRECAKRKAKDKLGNLNEEIEGDELQFSDLDPAWSPDSSDEDEIILSKRKRNHTKKKTRIKHKPEKVKTLENFQPVNNKYVDKNIIKKPHAVVSPMPSASAKSHAQFPFNVGDFVVLQTDMILANPPIWRVKEKAMLQKFTHFVKNGVLFYINLPCFTGWSPESKNVYEKVSVKTISQTKHETVVQMISTGLHVITSGRDIIAESMNENSKYQDNFEVYIQTLFSQALDSNFLTEIFQEKDEYFLDNVKVIDTFSNELLMRLKKVLAWPNVVTETAAKLPSYKIVQGPISSSRCICGIHGGASGVMLCGSTYHSETLSPTDENVPSLETSLCQTCIQYFEVLHRLCHQKFSLYAVCVDKVNEKRAIDFDKDTTVLLNELLADDVWLTEIFKLTRSFWGYVEKVIYDIQRIKKNKEFSMCQ
ncbi:uncharacterized protein LOC106661758 isoform X2 [Cimex lectularius]|uniref:DUF4211 domain-containing protein n=1 Tax=Cimex lectularius TaxID=79782 RepID=A0A8I6R947_CIMLE|nr:uncharacterized protein LOC106661758 isoform X2 [Cimex lectularius]